MKKKNIKKIDFQLVSNILSHILVRNEPDPLHRFNNRIVMLKNLDSLESNPLVHMEFALGIMQKYDDKKQLPPFEAGLVLGAAIVFASQTSLTRGHLSTFLKKIKDAQDTFVDNAAQQLVKSGAV